ncbi:hypothetical protein [Methylobacterium oxalidis]|uniref:Uncharacterized protein n=1 Tax=Methylobacterium oxalidis TaxID=944322 RepID=A0A512J814_9HYPH|nr:hypothetical protein [Methylobacterium oxalidis]GEP06101.1 hypothetical protein MOX02_41390 [Methylobacterium oxalidis]GJE30803.1 hypothetical protein LDDCCGHA_0973 [Methylobacterium oxalidis]GLS67516.1 hypothetical protein GCM10007888_59000 [Methylobacterium oxalidis]
MASVDNGLSAPPAGQADRNPADPGDAAYLELHQRREALERSLALVQVRLRCAPDAAERARVQAEEEDLLRELDRVLTQIRAAEYRRRPGARRW